MTYFGILWRAFFAARKIFVNFTYNLLKKGSYILLDSAQNFRLEEKILNKKVRKMAHGFWRYRLPKENPHFQLSHALGLHIFYKYLVYN